MKDQNVLDWVYDKIKSDYAHDGDKLEGLMFLFAIAKQKQIYSYIKKLDKYKKNLNLNSSYEMQKYVGAAEFTRFLLDEK